MACDCKLCIFENAVQICFLVYNLLMYIQYLKCYLSSAKIYISFKQRKGSTVDK